MDEMLRDRLVCGTNNEKIRKRLSESKLSLKKATDIALAMEMAEKDILDLHKSPLAAKTESNSDVNKLQVKPQSHRDPNTSDNRECYRCGGRHDSDTCRFKDAKCFACVKAGHISRVCRTKRKNGKSGETQGSHHIHEEEVNEQDPNQYPLYTIQSKRFPLTKWR